MKEALLQLARCPIIEAVIDIRCDMPPGFELGALESAARNAYRDTYGQFQKQILQKHRIETHGEEPPKVSAETGLQSFQFLQEDGRQLVQVRAQGFSFNRLAPYTSLDDYLPEIERTWKLYLGLAAPALVREIRLRYINRLLLPIVGGQVEFNEYLRISPRLPDEARLTFTGFVNQHSAVETDTGHEVTTILMLQESDEGRLPLIFDIEALAKQATEPNDWERLRAKIDELRALKNHVFKNTLTEKCLSLYSPSES